MAELVLKDESFVLMGIMFRVHNQLGPICKEKNYQDAIEKIFKKEDIEYEREKEIEIPFEGDKLGGFFADFIFCKKIILEIKAKPFIYKEDIRQVMRYLQATGLPLAIIVNFKRERVEYKRVINPHPRILNSEILDSSSLEPISEKLENRYLGIDWGEKRIGLALGDSETKIATPFKVVKNLGEVINVVKDEKIDKIIAGLPIKMDGKKSVSFRNAEKFIDELKNNLDIPVETIDERLTSKAADSLVGNKKTKAPRDAMAAMLILQSYLDRHNANTAN